MMSENLGEVGLGGSVLDKPGRGTSVPTAVRSDVNAGGSAKRMPSLFQMTAEERAKLSVRIIHQKVEQIKGDLHKARNSVERFMTSADAWKRDPGRKGVKEKFKELICSDGESSEEHMPAQVMSDTAVHT
jgi:hypothetical protein